MQLFIRRFWGFRPTTVPLITFGSTTYRDKLLRLSVSGDRIAFVATKNEKSGEDERGCILGMAEIGRRAVDTLAVVDESALPDANWENGRLKFPKAIPMVRAWRFADKPDLVKVLGRQLPRAAISGAALLNESEAAKVLAQPHELVDLPTSDVLTRERNISGRIASLHPTRGPTPSSGQRTVTVPGRDVGSVYILRFGRRNVRKIGHSYDPSKRTDAFNKNIPHEITGKSWAVFETQPTTSPQLAQEIEQRCINALRAKVSEVKCLPAMSRRSSAYGAMRSCAQSCPTKSSRQPQIITRTRATALVHNPPIDTSPALHPVLVFHVHTRSALRDPHILKPPAARVP